MDRQNNEQSTLFSSTHRAPRRSVLQNLLATRDPLVLQSSLRFIGKAVRHMKSCWEKLEAASITRKPPDRQTPPHRMIQHRLDIRNALAQLPKEAMGSPTLVGVNHGDEALRAVVGLGDLRAHFQPEWFCDAAALRGTPASCSQETWPEIAAVLCYPQTRIKNKS